MVGEAGGARQVRLPRALADEMLEHARHQTPNEACSIVAGDAPWAAGGAPLRFYPTSNAEHSPFRYLIEPTEQLRIVLEIDDRDEVVWGIVHSHTHTPAEPSPTDRRLAFYPAALYLIASLMDAQRPHIRAWTLEDEAVREVPLEVA